MISQRKWGWMGHTRCNHASNVTRQELEWNHKGNGKLVNQNRPGTEPLTQRQRQRNDMGQAEEDLSKPSSIRKLLVQSYVPRESKDISQGHGVPVRTDHKIYKTAFRCVMCEKKHTSTLLFTKQKKKYVDKSLLLVFRKL